MKILFHINENIKWKAVLDNVSNVIKSCNEANEPYQIEVAANGEAVLSLKQQAAVNLKLLDKLTEVSKEGVVFAVCRNSLNKFAISEGDLLGFIQVVPAGIVEVAQKEEEGFSYVKP